MSNFFFIMVLITISSLTVPSYADIYKYTDESGIIHFTNIPQGNKYKKIISENSKSSSRNYDHLISRISDKYDIESEIIKALITAESSWDTYAISKKGAMGLMQLMPTTAEDMQITNPFDPEQNIEAGTKYLRLLLDRFKGDLYLAIAAYNAGPRTVEMSQGIPSYPETIKFVKDVIAIYNKTNNKKHARIYKVSVNNGTVLYTNIPYSHKESAL